MMDSAGDCFKFSWELNGYDAHTSTIKSPLFATPFMATEWHMELDFSRNNNVQCVIPCRVRRQDNIGPPFVIMKLEVCVMTNRKSKPAFRISRNKLFSEKHGNFWSFNIEIPREELEKGFMTSRTLFITMEMKSGTFEHRSQAACWSDSEDKALLSKEIHKLYETGMYHDLVLKVSDEEFKVHKCILQSRWPYFMSKFSVDKSTSVICLDDCAGFKANVLKLIFPFVYSGDVKYVVVVEDEEELNDMLQLATDYNLYRLLEAICPVSPTFDVIQLMQSYRISLNMALRNAHTGQGMGDYRIVEIPLQSRDQNVPHIKSMDVRLYIKKEVNGYNWLLFSIVLGRLPKDHPVIIKCKLYVIDKSKDSYLLTEQNMLFDESTKCSFSLPDIDDFDEKLRQGFENYEGRRKTCHRFYKESEPIITFRELVDPRLKFLHEREEYDLKLDKQVERYDLHFRFDIKLADGESSTNTDSGTCVMEFKNGIVEFSEDMDKILNDNKRFSDCTITSGPMKMQVHKAILASRSEVFQKLFESNEEMRHPIEILKDLLYHFMQYIYSGKITPEPDRITHLLSAATYYKVDRLITLLKSKYNGDSSE